MTEILIENIINELKTELKEKYPDFRGIYLFGSRARGDFHKDSDYDLALIFERKIDWQFEDEITSLTCKYDLNYNIFIDDHIFNSNEILNPITPLRKNVKLEGLYYAS